jgi:hypothetical protein
VISSRLDAEERDDADPNTEESPIIDVPVEPNPPEHEWAPQAVAGGAHRRPSEVEPGQRGWQPQPPPSMPDAPEPPPPAPEPEVQSPWLPPEPAPRPMPPPQQPAQPPPAAQPQWQEPERSRRHTAAGEPEWRPAPAEGQFIPAGTPGSNWLSQVTENGSSTHATPPAPEPAPEPTPTPEPTMTPPRAEVPRGRHTTAAQSAAEPSRRARHSAPADVDPGRRPPSPTLAPPPAPPPPPAPQTESEREARHRGLDEPDPADGQHIGGQPLSELLARLQVGSTGGGRRRRREE